MIILADMMLIGTDLAAQSDHAILIERNRIKALGPASLVVRKHPHHRIVKVKRSVLMPGLVNTHTHLELPALSQRIRARDYSAWVLALLRIKRDLRRQDLLSAVRQNISAVIKTGTTTVADISTHAVSPGLLRASGLRAVVFREIIAMDPRKPLPFLPGLLVRPSALIRFGLSPHAPHTVSSSALSAIRDFAASRKLPLCMHAAETADEQALLRREPSSIKRIYHAAGWDIRWAPRARTSVEYLASNGMLSTGFLAVHAVHVTDNDIALLKRFRAAVAHCPRSNHRLKVGTMPLLRMLAAGIPVGLGSDSLASAASLNLWDEMRFLRKVHGPSAVSAAHVLGLATSGGARALGLDAEIGSLEPGKKADIIAVPMPPCGNGDLHSDLLMHTKSSNMTLVNGRILHATDAVTIDVSGSVRS